MAKQITYTCDLCQTTYTNEHTKRLLVSFKVGRISDAAGGTDDDSRMLEFCPTCLKTSYQLIVDCFPFLLAANFYESLVNPIKSPRREVLNEIRKRLSSR